MSRRNATLAGLVVLVVLFFAVNILANAMLRGARLDLTEEQLYTLSQGSRNIARNVEEPIRLRLYYAERAASGYPLFQAYGKRVREVLEEFASASRGKITLEVLEPEPFSEAEDEAVQHGLTPVPLGAGQTFYLGLVATNSVDGREVIPFFRPEEEQFLDYQIARLIHVLSNPERPVVSVMSALPVDGPRPTQFAPMPQGQPWQITRELRSLFDVRMVEMMDPTIPEETDVLVVIHPKRFPEEAVYNIDQYVLKGGRAIIFVDPHAESDLPPGIESNPLAGADYDRGSSLPRLFERWGVEMAPEQFVGDMKHAMRVQVRGTGGQPEAVNYVAYMRLDESALNADDPVTGRLGDLVLATPGSLSHASGAETSFTSLIQSSEQCMLYSVNKVKLFPDPKALIAEFQPRGVPATLAAHVTGHVTSAFTDQIPDSADAGAFVAESAEPINVVIVADVDMLTDPFWIQPVGFGQTILGYQKLSENGDFLLSEVENLSGSPDLLSIRARGRFTRPFTLVEAIQREAESKYLAEEQTLENKRRETQRKITELQQARPDQGEMILSPEQRAELERFQAELVETRKALRQVRLNLNKDIEQLGTKIKVINIGLMPLAVALAAVGVGAYRMARRRAA